MLLKQQYQIQPILVSRYGANGQHEGKDRKQTSSNPERETTFSSKRINCWLGIGKCLDKETVAASQYQNLLCDASLLQGSFVI